MNKLMTALFIVVLSASTTFAQETKKVAVNGISSVQVSSGIDLFITQGTTESLTINSSAALLKDIEVSQANGKLTIRFKDGFNWNRAFKNQSVKAYLNYKTLNAITASGGSDVKTENQLKADQLNVKASGGSDVTMNVACKTLIVNVSGGSDADLSGTAENMDANASGGSDLNAFELKVINAKVNVSGGSDAEVSVSKALDANASGGSDVNYKGSPAVKKNSSVSGDVRRVN